MRQGSRQANLPTAEVWESLSRRERQVLEGMMAGLSGAGIAASLGTSVSTVRSQIGGVMGKLGVHSQREAISLAFRSGWSLKDRR